MVVRQIDPGLRDIVLTAVNKHWVEHKTALPLAALGNILKQEGVNLEEFRLGDSLAQRLRKDFASDLVVSPSPKNAKILGVIPRNEEQHVQEAFQALGRSDTGGTTAPTRWLRAAVRLAFGRPISAGSRRIATLTPRFAFVDRAAGYGPDTDVGELEITAADIVERLSDENTKAFNERVRAAAEKWFQTHSLDFDQVATRSEVRNMSGTLLDRLIDTLSEEQLKRCILPLDVVAALRGA